MTNRVEQERLRALHAERERKPLLPIRAARENRVPIAWHAEDVAAPAFTGTRTVEAPIDELAAYIDWTFFFHAWELAVAIPRSSTIPRRARRHATCSTARTSCSTRSSSDGLLRARGVYGFWPAHADGDDIVLERRARSRSCASRLLTATRVRTRRSRTTSRRPSGLDDHVGAFAVGIHGAGELAARFEADHDDYRAIMVRAVADRLAEAFAEWLHERRPRRVVRRPTERLDSDDLIAERFRGIRPAFGYPACPDHSEKARLSGCSTPRSTGSTLTETYATLPAASVSGLYLGHPAARYFAVGRVGRDQVEDYAARKGVTVGRVRTVAQARTSRTTQSVDSRLQ